MVLILSYKQGWCMGVLQSPSRRRQQEHGHHFLHMWQLLAQWYYARAQYVPPAPPVVSTAPLVPGSAVPHHVVAPGSEKPALLWYKILVYFNEL